MAVDGSVKFDTKLDNSGLVKGLRSAAKAGVASLGTLSAAAIKVGSDFEAAMSGVYAISRANEEEAAMLKDAAIAAGEATQFSASQSADALSYLSLAGYSAAESVEALPKVLNLAAAGGMDLAYASDLLTDSMAVMGLGIEDMDNFSDQLAMAASKANTSVAQLGEAVLVAGGQAKLCGMSVEGMNAALSILADNGIKGSEGGTALRNTLKNLYTPTQSAAKAMAQLGLKTADAQGNLRPMEDVLRDLNAALEPLSDADKTAMMAEIFDTRTIAAATALLKNCGDRWDELTGYLTDCDGAAKEMADTMNDNLKGKMKLAASAAEAAGIAIYDGISGPLKDAADEGARVLSRLAKSIRSGELKGATESMGNLLGTLAQTLIRVTETVFPPLIKTLGFLGEHFGIIASATLAAVAAMKAYSAAIAIQAAVQKLTGFMKKLAEAENLATAAQMALNAAHLSNPIGLTAAVVAGLIAGLAALSIATHKETEAEKAAREEREAYIAEIDAEIEKNKELCESIESISDAYNDKLENAEAEAKLAEEYADKLENLLDKENRTLTEKKEIAAIVDRLNSLLPDLNWQYDEENDKLTDVNGELVNYKDNLYAVIEAKRREAEANAAMELYEESYKKQLELEQTRNELLVKREDLLQKLNTANEKADAEWDNMSDWQKSLYLFSDAYDNALREGQEFAAQILDIDLQLDKNTQALETCASTAENAWKSFSDSMENSAKSANENARGIKDAFAEACGNEVPRTVDGMKGKLQELYDKMAESGEYSDAFLTAFRTSLENAPDEVFNSIDNFAANVMEQFKELGRNVGEGTAQGTAENAGKAKDASVDMVDGMIEGAEAEAETNSPSKVFYRIGNFIAEGLRQGISENAYKAIAAARQMARDVELAAKDESVIKSPSHVFRDEVGAMIAQGVAVGISENAKAATDAYRDLAQSLKSQADLELISQAEYYDRMEQLRNQYLTRGTKEWLDATVDLYEGVKKIEEDAIEDEQKRREDAAKREKEDAEYYRDIGIIGEEEYYKRLGEIRDKYFEEDSDAWRDYTEKLIKYEKDKVEDAGEAIGGAFENAFGDVYEKQEAMSDKLKNLGVLYSSNDVELSNGNVIHVGGLADQKKVTDWINDFGNALKGVKDRLHNMGIDEEMVDAFFAEIANLDPEKANELAGYLLNASEAVFTSYVTDWIEKQNAAEKVAELLYGDDVKEAEENFKTDLRAILENAGKEIPEGFFDIGESAAEKFSESFLSGIRSAIEEAQSAFDNFAFSMGFSPDGTPAGATSYNSTYNFYSSGETVSQQLRSAQRNADLQRARYA